MSARMARRLCLAAWLPFVPVYVVGTLVFVQLGIARHYKVVAFIIYMMVLLAYLAACWLLLLLVNSREHAEVRAGYSTLPTAYPGLDLINPSDGQVLTLGRIDPVVAHVADTVDSGSRFGKVGPVLVPFRAFLSNPIAVGLTALGIVGLAVAVFAVAWIFASESYSEGELLVALGGGGLCIIVLTLVPTLAIVSLPAFQNVRSLATAFPTATAFLVDGSTGIADSAVLLTRTDGDRLEGARPRGTSYALLLDDTIVFWNRSGKWLLPYLAIPRSRIAHAHGAMVRTLSQPLPGIIFDVLGAENGSTEIPLLANAPILSTPGRMLVARDNATAQILHWLTS